jgi:cytochrome c peroxidase
MSFQQFPKLIYAGLFALAGVVLSTGCQQSPPPPVPTVDEPVVEMPGDAPDVEMPGEESAETPDDAAPAETPTAEPVAFEVKVPLGLPPLPIPADNPMTAEKVELGRMLYFDTRLSKDGTISCATCHDPLMAWTEHKPTSTGIGSQLGGANSPTVINSAYATTQFWDGRAASLEEQALGPIENPIEMGHSLPEMIATLNGLEGYKQHFQDVFGSEVNKEGISQAIAAFERTVLSGNSPYDKFMAGDENALNEAQKRGLELFNNSGCAECHTPPLFSSYDFYNAGVSIEKNEPGRKAVTNDEADLGAFRVPMLREVANTGPYFHDGSAEKLEDAVALMARGGNDNPNLSEMLKSVRDVELTEENQKDLVEFLKALSGEYPIIDPPATLP